MNVHGWAFPEADQFMAKELKPDGTYQASHLAAALRYITDGSFDVAIDGGAHVGTWSKILSGRFVRVIAFEPSHETAEALRTNMAHFDCRNVQVHESALGAHEGFVTMTLEADAAALANTGGYHVTPGGTVPVVTIDSFSLPTLGLLKLDVEGSEVSALEGAEETIARCRPVIVFENKGLWRKHFGLAKEAPQQWLTAHGYKHLEKAGCDAIWGPVR